MGIALCDQLSGPNPIGSASAGLGGAASLVRATEAKGAVRRQRFSFTIPASGNGSTNGDQIVIGRLKPTDRIYAVKILNPAMGAAVTLAAGKRDRNNSANNDNNHYLLPAGVTNPGILDANINLGEQVGVDPTGATTDTGNAVTPGAEGGGFGNAAVEPMLTIGGGNPTAGAVVTGWFDYMGDEP